MWSERLVGAAGLPTQQYGAVGLLDFEAVEDGKDPTDVIADQFKASYILPLQSEQDGGQIAAVRT